MYGLVFEIVEEWVIKTQGIDVWHQIKDKANCKVKDLGYLRREYYPDEQLVVLIQAASDLLSISVADILEAFGTTLRQWLSNLNAMHDHVQQSFSDPDKFVAPIFWCENCDEVDGSILLHYYSLRGTLLVPMVVGIVEELADYHFNVKVKMNQLELQGDVENGGRPFTTWRITAVDASQQWKLAPATTTMEEPVDFTGVKLPEKCPFSGKKLNNKTTTKIDAVEGDLPQDDTATPSTAAATTTTSSSSGGCPFSKMNKSKIGVCPVQHDQHQVQAQQEQQDNSGGEIGMTHLKMKEVFPFHVLVNKEFTILQVGNSLPKLMDHPEGSALFIGKHIQDLLQITRPVLGSAWEWKALQKLADQHFFLTPKMSHASTLHKRVSMEDSTIKFKASMVTLTSNRVMFILHPDARNVIDLNQMGLTMSDLPLVSCQRDTVFLGEYITQEVDKAHKLDLLSKKLETEKNLSNTLLYNMLPKGVANDLRAGKTVEPKLHENVTVFFSDVEGFTQICDQVDPWDVIDMLNRLYGVMDFLAAKFDLYKVETVGDAYVCCSGLPEPDDLHAEKIANFALAVTECVKHIKSPVDSKTPIRLRVGLHTGSCTAGVVGTLTPHYCLFGDTINTCARHETTGVAGKIHCSSTFYWKLTQDNSHKFKIQPRGIVSLKGKGDFYTYWLEKGTQYNKTAGPGSIKALSEQVSHMLASNKFQKRRYFRRNGDMRQIATDGQTVGTGSCTASVSTGISGSTGTGTSSSDNHDDQVDRIPSDELEMSDDDSMQSEVSDLDQKDDDFMDDSGLDETSSNLVWDDSLSLQSLTWNVQESMSTLLLGALSDTDADASQDKELLTNQVKTFVDHISSYFPEDRQSNSFRNACYVVQSIDFLWLCALRGIRDGTSNIGAVDWNPWNRFILAFVALTHRITPKGQSSCSPRQASDLAVNVLEDEFPELYNEIVLVYPGFLYHVRRLTSATDVYCSAAKTESQANAFGKAMQSVSIDERAIKQRTMAAMEQIVVLSVLSHYTQDYEVFSKWKEAEFEDSSSFSRHKWHKDQVAHCKEVVLPLLSRIEMILPDPQSRPLRDRVERNLGLWMIEDFADAPGADASQSSLITTLGKTQVKEDMPAVKVVVKILTKLLKKVVKYHQVGTTVSSQTKGAQQSTEGGIPASDIQMVVPIRPSEPNMDSSDVELDPQVVGELRDYVTTIASGYLENEFHCFEHASNVAVMASLLLSRIQKGAICADPFVHFGVVLAALVHDVGHTGVTNAQLGKERPDIANKYKHSLAEQRSLDTALTLLKNDQYRSLTSCLFNNKSSERQRFRHILVNCIMATDIFEKELENLQTKRWEIAFGEASSSVTLPFEKEQYEATALMELVLKASDIAHTMQKWNVFQKWNRRLFLEMYKAYQAGRGGNKDPLQSWYVGELWFFDNKVIPLAQKVQTCGAFGPTGDECLQYAKLNRRKWEKMGKTVVSHLAQWAQQEMQTPAPLPKIVSMAPSVSTSEEESSSTPPSSSSSPTVATNIRNKTAEKKASSRGLFSTFKKFVSRRKRSTTLPPLAGSSHGRGRSEESVDNLLNTAIIVVEE